MIEYVEFELFDGKCQINKCEHPAKYYARWGPHRLRLVCEDHKKEITGMHWEGAKYVFDPPSWLQAGESKGG
jgi:hypothetical protein